MLQENIQKKAGYITARYGANSLGLIRLLCSYPFFRESASKSTLNRLLGIPMLSFEKVLRETAGIYYQFDHDGRFKVKDDKRGVFITADDPFRSLSKRIVGQIRGLFDSLDEFASVPHNSIGIGVDVKCFADRGDHEALYQFVNEQRELFDDNVFADAITKFDDAVTMVDEPLGPYRLYEAGHALACLIRQHPPKSTQGDKPLPFASSEELGSVLFGLTQRSVRNVPEALRAALLEVHPTGRFEGRDFLLCETETIFQKLGWPENIDFTLDMLTGVGGTQAAVISTPSRTAEPMSCEPSGKGVGECDEELLTRGVNHTIKYAAANINSLDRDERNLALYGSEEGKLCFHKISKGIRAGLNKSIGDGPLDGKRAVLQMVSALRQSPAVRGMTSEQLVMLAASRFVALKGAWDFSGPESWQKTS